MHSLRGIISIFLPPSFFFFSQHFVGTLFIDASGHAYHRAVDSISRNRMKQTAVSLSPKSSSFSVNLPHGEWLIELIPAYDRKFTKSDYDVW